MAKETVFQLQITGPDGRDTIIIRPGETAIIGRQSSNIVYLKHSLVSRQHAQIVCTANGCQLTDLGSANGTRLNNEKLHPNVPTPLGEASKIQIGPYLLSIHQTEAEVEPELPQLLEADQARTPDSGDAPPIQPPPPPVAEERPLPPPIPLGLSPKRSRYLQYLPGIYHTDFMTRFLALFESIMVPIEWNVDNFDLFLSPHTAPTAFLPWLSSWFELTFDDTWSDAQRRTLLAEAHWIYARRGTKSALSRLLEIYTGHLPEINDQIKDAPFSFTVKIPLSRSQINVEIIQQLIDTHKPAHTTYKLQLKKR